VGIGQYPGGADCYAGLVTLHTGLDLAPDRIHAIGLEEVARATDRIRTELGVVDEVAHRAALPHVPPADVEALFQGHLDRVLPHLPEYFAVLPAAPFRVRRLDPALEADLTYGYYEPPGADGCGYYRYNGTHPPVVQSATLIYHEGLPGHHLQIARQAENTALHPIRREPNNLRPSRSAATSRAGASTPRACATRSACTPTRSTPTGACAWNASRPAGSWSTPA
jgi:uncharacterized protein (DUF885 family)